MEGASIEKALGRIEAALTRIENAAARAPAPTTRVADRDWAGDRADRDLAERHERLREAVAQSLRQLDALLAGGRP